MPLLARSNLTDVGGEGEGRKILLVARMKGARFRRWQRCSVSVVEYDQIPQGKGGEKAARFPQWKSRPASILEYRPDLFRTRRTQGSVYCKSLHCWFGFVSLRLRGENSEASSETKPFFHSTHNGEPHAWGMPGLMDTFARTKSQSQVWSPLGSCASQANGSGCSRSVAS